MSGEVVIELKDVHKSYRFGKMMTPALRGVNLKIHSGEFTAVVGASGSGKSTLLNIVGCIDSPDVGEVYLQNRSILSLDDDEKSDLRNRRIGFIFQNFNLIPVLNVQENVDLPLTIQKDLDKKSRRERVIEVLEQVGIADFKNHLPDQLSGGQRQRVAIARALVTQPSVVLADEPTANLDSQNAHKIIDLMQSINEKTKVTFLFSTHDEKLMSRVKSILRIQDGVLLA
ncbi:MAG: hypothetical protein RIR26_2351 [Pseudomonadota bacterium]